MAEFPALGRGRYPTSKFSGKVRGYKRMKCSECGREYYIKTGEGHKEYKTCSSEHSSERQARIRSKNASNYSHSKKTIGLYLDLELYKKAKKIAAMKNKPFSKWVRGLIEKEIKREQR